jgi:NOL1/NOP2/fmu family ribosome biogenesis protein
MKIQILDRAKKKKFIAGLSNLGIGKISELLIRSGKERIRAYSGDLSNEQIMEIWRLLPIEGIGLYAGKDIVNRSGVREVRLSLDGMHLWKEQLTERVLELTKEQEDDWFAGKNIELDEGQFGSEGFVSVKSGNDFVGMGKVGDKGKTLFSFLPKERRRKERMS